MPRYYCDYCDTYLTHDSPSVRKQHNAGYKHKGNVRIYYQQYEAQQNQYLIDQKVKEHLGQAAAFGAYNQMRPRLPIPMMPIPGNPQMQMNPSLYPGMRPPAPLPRPIPGYPGMPPMFSPPGTSSMSRPMPIPMAAPGSSGTPTSPMFNPAMYQPNPSLPPPPGPPAGGFGSPNANAQSPEPNH